MEGSGLEKCPKLRFPGFDEPWKSIAFGDLVHEYSDRTKEENEDTLLSAAIEGMFLNTELFGHQRGASNKGYKKIKHGTMVLSTQNLHLGNANVNQRFEHGMVSPAYKTYDIIGCSVDLIAQWIKSDAAKRFFYNATTVGASVCRRNVEWDTLYEQSLYLPCRDEQEKVAKFLALLSNRINKQQQFVAALKKYKRGAVDGLLAQKIKFPTSDTWEEMIISDLFTPISDKGHSDLTVLTIVQGTGTLPRDSVDRRISYDKSNTNTYKRVVENDFILHLRSFEGGLEIANSEGIVSPAYTILRASRKISPKFYYAYFRSYWFISNKLRIAVEGIRDGKSINMDTFWNIKIPYPSLSEQIQIAEYLQVIDLKLTNAEKTLENLMNIRSGLMQQFFI